MNDLPEPYVLGWHTPDPFTVCTHCKKVGQRVDAGVPDVPTVVFVLGATCLLSPFLRSAPCTHGSQPNHPLLFLQWPASFRDISWWTHATGAGRRPPQQPMPRFYFYYSLVLLLLGTLWSSLSSLGSLGMPLAHPTFSMRQSHFCEVPSGFGAYLKILNLQGNKVL